MDLAYRDGPLAAPLPGYLTTAHSPGNGDQQSLTRIGGVAAAAVGNDVASLESIGATEQHPVIRVQGGPAEARAVLSDAP